MKLLICLTLYLMSFILVHAQGDVLFVMPDNDGQLSKSFYDTFKGIYPGKVYSVTKSRHDSALDSNFRHFVFIEEKEENFQVEASIIMILFGKQTTIKINLRSGDYLMIHLSSLRYSLFLIKEIDPFVFKSYSLMLENMIK